MASYGRVTIFGTSIGTEVWATSFALASSVPPSSWDQSIGDAEAAAAAAVALPANLASLMSSTLTMTQLRWEQRDIATNALQGVSTAVKLSGGQGTGSANKTLQDCVVFSLRTSTPGPRGRGRMYWPALQASLGYTTGQMAVPTPASVAADAKTYMTGIASAILGASGSLFADLFPVVYSTKDRAVHRVNRIQVGGVLDTQRRRRHNVPESYASVSLP